MKHHRLAFVVRQTLISLILPLGAALTAGACSSELSWQSDISHFESELADRHPDLFFQISSDQFHQEVERLRQTSDQLTPQEIILELARITAWMLKGRDSHTGVNLLQKPYFTLLPLRLKWFGGDLHVVGVPPKDQAALGKRVTRIGDISADDLRREASNYIVHANDIWARRQTAIHLISPEFLFHLGATDDPRRATLWLEGPGEESSSVTLEASSDQLNLALIPGKDQELPLHLQTAERLQNYWFSHIPEERALYVHYFRCIEMKSQSFEAFTQEVFRFADEHSVEKLILDIRHNTGGSSELIWPFIRAVQERPSLNRADRFFVIIGDETFSSGLFACAYLDHETAATFVGEPTGGKPTRRYGQLSNSFTLPFSGVQVNCSAKYFDLGSKWGVEDTPSFMPDIQVPLSYEDYAASRDPVLDHIFEHN